MKVIINALIISLTTPKDVLFTFISFGVSCSNKQLNKILLFLVFCGDVGSMTFDIKLYFDIHKQVNLS